MTVSKLILLAGFGLGWMFNAQAGTVVQCGQDACPVSFSIKIDGSHSEAGGGQFFYDAKTGDIVLDTENNIRGGGRVTNTGSLMWTMMDGSSIRINNIEGNADPVVGFSLAASTTSSSHSFAFSFDLPIAIEGDILAESKLSYSLTGTSTAGAQVSPTIGNKILHAVDVDTSIGGIGKLDKGVDIGDTFYFSPGPDVQNSPAYSASNYIVGDLDYDMMAVVLAFSLSANSNVAMSGFVSQTEVPLPATFWMLGAALGAAGIARRKK